MCVRQKLHDAAASVLQSSAVLLYGQNNISHKSKSIAKKNHNKTIPIFQITQMIDDFTNKLEWYLQNEHI